MKSLNEKLAEVCGMEWKQVYWCVSGVPKYLHHNAIDCVCDGMELWNPTQDLNQLRECYLALSDEEQGNAATHFAAALADSTGFRDTDPSTLGFYWLLNSIFKHPELVAQAILKAKGVE